MRILDRYIVRSFLTSAALWFAVMMSLRIVVDLFLSMDEFVKLGLPFWGMVGQIVQYYSYHCLTYFIELGGVIIVVSAAFTLAMMNHTNELTAMMASGVSLHRVAWPIILCSILLGGMIIVDQELLIPRVADKLVRDKDDVPGTKQFQVRLVSDSSGSVWYSPDFSTAAQTMGSPWVLLHDAELDVIAKISGKQASPGKLDGVEGWLFSGAFMARPGGSHEAWTFNPSTDKVYTPLGPEAMIRNAGGDPRQADIVISNLQIADARAGLSVRGRLEPDPPREGQGRSGTLRDARFIFRTSAGRDLGTFVAPVARWQSDALGQTCWILTDGRLFYPSDLTAQNLNLRQSSHWLDYMSTSQISQLLRLRRVNDMKMAILTSHVRMTEPINNLIMLLLGLPFILSRERNIKASAGLCLLIVGAFYAFIYICRYISLPADWSALSAWMPILLFGPIAVAMLDSVKT